MRIHSLLSASVLGAVVALAACGGGSPMEPSTPLEAYTDMPGAASMVAPKKVAACKPLPAATRSATIGILGGTINIGPHTLWIAPGAIRSGTKTITATMVANDPANSVKFGPEGLRFSVPGLLTMSYANCTKTSLLAKAQVVYTSNDLRSILELLPSIDNPFKKTTVGTITHFSRYAIAF